MIGQRIRGIENLLTLLQGGLLVVVFWIWLVGFLFISTQGETIDLSAYLGSYTIYCVVVVVGFSFQALMRNRERTDLYEASLVSKIPLAFRQSAFSIFALLFFLVLTKDRFLSRVFLVSFYPALYFTLLWTNHKLPEYLGRKFFRGSREERTLLVGSGDETDRLKGWLERKARFGFRCVGALSRRAVGRTSAGLPVLGSPDEIDRIIEEEKISHVIVLNFREDLENPRAFLKVIQSRGVRLHILSRMAEILDHPVFIEQDEEFHFITLHEEPLENPLNRALKRMLDLAIAIPLVVLLLPFLTLLIWLLQRFQSPGPIFYIQSRACLQNERFKIFKFRTMHPDHGDASRQATSGDERIYPAGRWLRRFSLDEFPQFLNVLRGEMSVVGPRPHLLEHNRQFSDALQNYHSRTFVKPGITGLAQVRGFRGETRTVEDVRQRLESDLFYLENWSLLLDLGIILRTVWHVILPPPAAR